MTFLLGITGQIEFAKIILASTGTLWHCKYEYFYGPDWKTVHGIESTLSQVSHISKSHDKIVFNLPLQIYFKTTTPYGCKFI